MNGFQNPYTSRQFGPALSATRGFLNSYMQYMQMRSQMQNQRIMNQYRQSLLEQGEKRIGISQQYLDLAKEKVEEPETPSQMLNKRLFEATEGWGEEEWGAAAKKKFLGTEKQPFTEGAIAKTLGELESGGAKSIWGLDVMQFGKGERGRQNAINHALRNLGPDWPQIAPEAAEIIERKWPGEEPLTATPIDLTTPLASRLVDTKEGEASSLTGKFPSPAMGEGRPTLGDVIRRGGKRYIIVGYDTDGEPLVDEF